MPIISPVCNDLLSSMTGEDGNIASAGDAWCITNICEIYEMEIHDSLCPYGLGYNAWSTLCNVSRGRITWCLAQVFPSAWQTFAEYLHNNSINFDNSRCNWKHVVYRSATLCPLRHMDDLGAKVWLLYRPRRCCVSLTTESVHETNPNPLKLSFSVEVLDNIKAYTLDPS